MLRRANYEIVAYSVSAIIIALTVAMVTIVLYMGRGIDFSTLDLTSQVSGLVIGVFIAANAVSRIEGVLEG